LKLEIFILNEINWTIDLITPNEIMLKITNELFKISDKLDFINIYNEMIKFSMFEYNIFYKFDLYKITISCLILSFEFFEKTKNHAISLFQILDIDETYLIMECKKFIKLEIDKKKEYEFYKYNNRNIYFENIDSENNSISNENSSDKKELSCLNIIHIMTN